MHFLAGDRTFDEYHEITASIALCRCDLKDPFIATLHESIRSILCTILELSFAIHGRAQAERAACGMITSGKDLDQGPEDVFPSTQGLGQTLQNLLLWTAEPCGSGRVLLLIARLSDYAPAFAAEVMDASIAVPCAEATAAPETFRLAIASVPPRTSCATSPRAASCALSHRPARRPPPRARRCPAPRRRCTAASRAGPRSSGMYKVGTPAHHWPRPRPMNVLPAAASARSTRGARANVRAAQTAVEALRRKTGLDNDDALWKDVADSEDRFAQICGAKDIDVELRIELRRHDTATYPKQQHLLALKKASLTSLHPPKFDVILLDAPFSASFTWAHLQELPVPALAADPSFIFMWVGSGAGEGLESGREVLARWGYRRCEDVVWVRTNKTTNRGPGTDAPTSSLLTRTKQHCLIGIRGTVRRSTDSWFVHCNVDTDVIFWEGDAADPTRKPPEMYALIENFCLGTRRLEVFGRARSSLRRGWVTALAPGQEVEPGSVEGVPWDRTQWDADIRALAGGGKAVVPTSGEIDALRPKSPFRPGAQGAGGAGGGAGGARRGGPPNMNQGGAAQGQLMAQPMMGMGMGMPMGMGVGMGGGMGGGVGVEGMMQWPGMMGGGMGATMGGGMGGMGPMGMGFGFGGGMAGGWGDQGQFAMGDQGQYAMGDQGQYAMGDQAQYAMGDQAQYAMSDQAQYGMGEQAQYGMEGVWDDGMAGAMGMGGMGAMNGGVGAMNGSMGMGMGQQQWGAGGAFEGY
ncbi:MT-A70-domain-containing protein [Mycena latifolia]|nr:MT-A70-domain-containing protein [Mycena latifolia]